MRIKVIRRFKKTCYTIGDMLIDDRWFCNTLEPPVGTIDESLNAGSGKAIPPGTYNIKMRYSPKFRRRLPLLFSPESTDGKVVGSSYNGGGGRSFILIHAGNTSSDTKGCILVGKNLCVGKVQYSRDTLNALVNRISASQGNGEKIIITIQDSYI